MRCSDSRIRLSRIAVVVCAALACGCANFRMPRIDPTGESLFVYDPAPATPAYGTAAYDPSPYYYTPAEKGTRFNLPGRPEGCFAQIKPGPFFPRETASQNEHRADRPAGHASRGRTREQ